MVEEDPLTWETEPSENFRNEHFLYRGIHINIWRTFKNLQKIDPSFFMTKNAIEGLSTDWSKYSTPDVTLTHVNSDLTVYGIAEIKIEKLRNVIEENNFSLIIQHHPIREETETECINRAHTLIEGFNERNTSKIRRKISKITEWADNMSPIIEEEN